MFSPAVGMEAVVHAGEPDGYRLACLGPDHRCRKPSHRPLDLHDRGVLGTRRLAPERGGEKPSSPDSNTYDNDDISPTLQPRHPPSLAHHLHPLHSSFSFGRHLLSSESRPVNAFLSQSSAAP